MRRRAFALAVVTLSCAACEGDPPPPGEPAPAPELAPDPSAIHLMGTGAMTPLAARLAAAWAARGGEPRLIVEPSVGSTGGVRAVVDGAVDLGSVSRPLRDDERARGLVTVPVARSIVVIAASEAAPVRQLSSAQLVALVAGESTRLPDGTPATFLLRDRDESANGAFDAMVPAMASARERAYRTGRWRVVYHDAAMGEALAATPGALGLFDLGAIVAWRLPLLPVAIDGVLPSLASAESGAWRGTRELTIVYRPERAARVQPFVRFVLSDEGRRIARESGYLAPSEAPP